MMHLCMSSDQSDLPSLFLYRMCSVPIVLPELPQPHFEHLERCCKKTLAESQARHNSAFLAHFCDRYCEVSTIHAERRWPYFVVLESRFRPDENLRDTSNAAVIHIVTLVVSAFSGRRLMSTAPLQDKCLLQELTPGCASRVLAELVVRVENKTKQNKKRQIRNKTNTNLKGLNVFL